ncbi:hypothetical protein BDN70DRAFT_548537 [Pholiota conissans]|uniref:Uncharacterized protein n=1 Tax=Pholiota conissans TaxID=109636 RepID=A0A9P5Z558_9AGAR|nr:hypothetical protein BDN70DRAFT_548537 [Pholiota conissans]
MIDWSLVRPGQKLWLISRVVIARFGRHVTVEDVRAAGMVPHIVTCAPKSNEYSDRLEERNHIISISVDGKPGVSIAQLISVKGNESEPAFLDGGSDAVFEKFGWRTTQLKFDWPGLTQRPQGIEEDVPVMTRSKFAYLAASSIEAAVRRVTYHPKFQTINDATKQWDLRCLDLNKVQLLSLNYYKKV